MAQQPWKTDKWFTSPWNFEPALREQLHFPKQIQFHDITLRDGEQQTGVIFNLDDKLRIAEALAECGVQRIEAGMPAVSAVDTAAIKEIVKRNLGPKTYAFARCMVDDVKRAVDCGVQGIVMEVPSSKHIIELAYRWPLEKAIDASIKSTAYAHEQGLEVVFFPIDLTRAEIDWALDMIVRVAKEGHMDALALVDTFGVLAPQAVQYLVREARKRTNARLETHFHMDFGLGIANTIAALSEGAEVVHSTILGLGERAGNVPMEETAMALLTLYGIDAGLNTKAFYKTARLLEEITGQNYPTNRPVVGKQLFEVESGMPVTFWQTCREKNPTECFPYRWDLVGQPYPQITLGKGSGIDSVKARLDKLGLQATEEEALKLVTTSKDYAIKTKRLLTDEEFCEVLSNTFPEKFGYLVKK